MKTTFQRVDKLSRKVAGLSDSLLALRNDIRPAHVEAVGDATPVDVLQAVIAASRAQAEALAEAVGRLPCPDAHDSTKPFTVGGCSRERPDCDICRALADYRKAKG